MSTLTRRFLLRCLLALAITASRTAAAGAVGGYTADYTGYSHGLIVLKLTATLLLTEFGYDAHVSFYTAGLANFIVHADNDSHAAGLFHDAQATPKLFEGSGHLRGSVRLTRMKYVNGNPVIQALNPPIEQERSAVSAMQSAGTIDTLSAAVLLIRRVGQAGQCDGTVNTFDGRRLATQTCHTIGQERLEHTGRSIYAGPVLRCDFEGRQLAGFVRGENDAELRRPRHGTAWLADVVTNAPPVPVRIAFDNKILGQVTLYLTSVTASR